MPSSQWNDDYDDEPEQVPQVLYNPPPQAAAQAQSAAPVGYVQAAPAHPGYAKKKVKTYKRQQRFTAPESRFSYGTINNAAEVLAKDITNLKDGVEFSIVNCPLIVHAVICSTIREERKYLEIPCENFKPLSNCSYSVQTDSIVIDGIASVKLGQLDFCYKLSLPESFFDKIIPLPESVLRKHLTADAKLDILQKKYPESEGYSIKFVQLAGV